jgi:hypothetical protein
MAAAARPPTKKYFTVAEANAMLPLVRLIVRDIAMLTAELRERKARLQRLQARDGLTATAREEIERIEADTDRAEAQLWAYVEELDNLKIELKDPLTGLIDFPSRKDGREVYLCWKLDEPAVAYWHDLHAGFAGRQPVTDDAPEGRF